MWKKILKIVFVIISVSAGLILLLALLGATVHAAGLVDETVQNNTIYAKYPLTNYQLDFFVDSNWDWLPWNWSDGISKQIMYGLYAITNFIWTISVYLSSATGYLVQEAYSLDFISNTADSIGKNMQTLAGVTSSGFSSSGFYLGFLLIFILVVGLYVVYTGLIKRETSKAIRAILNFVVIFILSSAFIAFSPSYISKINDFSNDISNASLSLGTKIIMPNSQTGGEKGSELIRENLFAVQIKQPWLLLQYGDSNIKKVGKERSESLLSISPDENKGKDREEIVKKEIEEKDNTNLTIPKTIVRLGITVFLFFFNIGISIFVFLLTGIMIFSQILFIIYAMLLPISFLLSMIPTFDGMTKKAITKLFNVIMLRAGITLIITAAFSISTMVYTLTSNYPFFVIAFLQIVVFAGIYFKLGDLMGMFSLQSNDTQQMGRRIFRRPYMLFNRHVRRLERQLGRNTAGTPTSKTSKNNSGSNSSAEGSKRNKKEEMRSSRSSTVAKEQQINKSKSENRTGLSDLPSNLSKKTEQQSSQVENNEKKKQPEKQNGVKKNHGDIKSRSEQKFKRPLVSSVVKNTSPPAAVDSLKNKPATKQVRENLTKDQIKTDTPRIQDNDKRKMVPESTEKTRRVNKPTNPEIQRRSNSTIEKIKNNKNTSIEPNIEKRGHRR